MKVPVLLAIVVLANAAGNVALAHGMRQIGDISSYSPLDLAASGIAAMANPWVVSGVALLLLFFVAHAIVLSCADLSYVLLVTSIGYVAVALLGRIFLDEQISLQRWFGIAAITAGVMLAGSTPAAGSLTARGKR